MAHLARCSKPETEPEFGPVLSRLEAHIEVTEASIVDFRIVDDHAAING
jgi:hypothetical protein